MSTNELLKTIIESENGSEAQEIAIVTLATRMATEGAVSGNLIDWLEAGDFEGDETVESLVAEWNSEAETAYGLHARPFGIGAQPKNHTRLDEDDDRARYGVVYYAQPLTDEEVYSFELVVL